MDLKGIMLSELSQTEQVKQSALSVTQNLKNKKNVYNKTESPRYREQIVSTRMEKGRVKQNSRMELLDTNYYE